jgi:hypothetical protein
MAMKKAATEKQIERMTVERRRYLRDRLGKINGLHGTFYGGWRIGSKDSVLPTPPAVKAAEKEIARLGKLVNRFAIRQKAYREGIARRKRAISEQIHRVIEFEQDPEKALKLLDRFETMKF